MDSYDDDDVKDLRTLDDPASTLGGEFDAEQAQVDLTDRFLGEDVDAIGGPPSAKPLHMPRAQPVNQATMVCLRGPCCYLWCMTTRFGMDTGDEVRVQRHRVCIRHQEEVQLADQNVYVCEQWWPAWLSFVPEFLRAPMRPHLRAAWEKHLERGGYNFKDWRWFHLDSFDWDAADRRGYSAPGGGDQYFRDKETAAARTGHGAPVPKDEG